MFGEGATKTLGLEKVFCDLSLFDLSPESETFNHITAVKIFEGPAPAEVSEGVGERVPLARSKIEKRIIGIEEKKIVAFGQISLRRFLDSIQRRTHELRDLQFARGRHPAGVGLQNLLQIGLGGRVVQMQKGILTR